AGYCARGTLHAFPTRRSSDLGLAHQPEAVAAEVVHVRVDRGDRRRHGHRGFDRIATFGKREAPGLDRIAMRRRYDAATMSGRMKDRKSTRLNSSHVKISYAVF